MPIFDFYCPKCGIFELMTGFKREGETTTCPTCGAPSPRIFSPPTFSRVFCGTRHLLLRRQEKGVEPRVVRKGEGDPLEAKALSHQHNHKHAHADTAPGYPPWMIKH